MTLQHNYSPQLTSVVLTKIALFPYFESLSCKKAFGLCRSFYHLPPGIRFDVPLSVNPWFSDLFDVRQNRLGLPDVLPGIVPITF